MDANSIIDAFRNGDKVVAEQNLLLLPRPATVRATFKFLSYPQTVKKVSLLHLAAIWGWMNVVEDLVTNYECAIDCKDECGHTPLHYAVSKGHFEIVKYFIRKMRSAHISSNIGYTPLHVACTNGHLDIAKYLISEANCDPLCGNNRGFTPLHSACRFNHFHIVQYLVGELECDPSCVTNDEGETLFHLVCRYGHLKIAKYIMDVSADCDPSSPNLRGEVQQTPLHLACENGHFDTVKYLVDELQCNPSWENNVGNTPLHYACLHNHANIVRYLLSTGKANPLSKNKRGRTALSYASQNYDIIKLFEPFEECRIAFPVHTFTKLILTGDSGAGKTTMTELIIRLANSTATESVDECYITDVEHYTAGIIPHYIQSEKLGNYVIYDFAGQQEYYSSHSAVLEQVMQKSPAIFLCIVDLSKSKEKTCESLHYWLTYIDNACSISDGKSHVLVVGSHADKVTLEEELTEKNLLLKKIFFGRVKRQQYAGYLSMNCCKPNADDSHSFIDLLTKAQEAVAASQPVIHYYSHVVYAFLRTKLNVLGCTLHDLISEIDKENDSSLPKDQSVLSEILNTLSDKGLIFFLHNHQSSWIIVKTEDLLKEINGTLFAPDHFKEHRELASNTGIVLVSSLRKVFPVYRSDMLIEFFTSLEFCRPVDPSVLQYTNLQTTPSYSTADPLYFFPGLIKSERPDSLVQQGDLEFGWCLKCMDPHEFFSSRFLHVLLLSVAYTFPLASQAISSSVRGLQRTCIVWRNGIFWRNLDNIKTVIELLDKNRCVLVAMSCNDNSPVEHAELRSSVIALVRNLQKQYCSRLNLCEFLISPDLIQQYPLDNLPDSDLFDVHHVARSMLLHKKGVPSYKDGLAYLAVDKFPFEPYHKLSFSSVCQLLDPNKAVNLVPDPLLQEVKQFCQFKESLTFGELRVHLNKISLFASRNPLEVAGLADEDAPSRGIDLSTSATLNASSTPPSVKCLLMACKNVTDWNTLGIHLGLTTSQLNDIRVTNLGLGLVKLKTEMFDAWLKTSPGASWRGLILALKSMDENTIASEIQAEFDRGFNLANQVAQQKPTPKNENPDIAKGNSVVSNPVTKRHDVHDMAAQTDSWQLIKVQVFQFFHTYYCEALATLAVLLAFFVLLLYNIIFIV